MDKIYKHAKRVIIWLGPTEDNSNEVFDLMQEFRSGLSIFRESGRYGFPHPDHRFWLDLGNLFHRSWFSRLWILQEVVLAEDKIIMCGDRTVSWDDFTELIRLTEGGGCRAKINQGRAPNFTRANAIISVTHANTVKSLMDTKSGPELLLILLNFTRVRECSLPNDCIYAILGLIKSNMREDIVHTKLVDYRLGHTDLFRRIARQYSLTTDTGLSVLSMADATNRSPSWCPDWTAGLVYSRFLSMVPSYTSGISPVWNNCGNAITLDEKEESIYVHGFSIDQVRTVGIPWPTKAADDSEIRPWEENSYSIANSTISASSLLPTYVRTLVGNVMRDMSLCTEDFTGEYEKWRHEMHCSNEACPRRPHDPMTVTPERRSFYDAFGPNCIGRRFFSTVSGRIGVGPRDLESGDQVCVFLNGRPLYILRSKDRDPSLDALEESDVKKVNKEHFRLVGEAYVDGLMSGEAFGLSLRGPITDFCIT